jgi:glycosyltransferase involved in cell wall biosynthesis
LALSFGKPIVAPKLGCIADTLNGSPNFLYEPNENRGLINAMRSVIDSDAQIEEIGRFNLELAKRAGWADIAQRTFHAYQKSLNR